MIRLTTILLLLTTSLTLAQEPGEGKKNPAPNPVAVARSFLPPDATLATLYTFDFHTGKVSKRWPAVLTGHILAPDSKDIVFAYYTPREIHTVDKTLFLALLHRTSHGYQQVYVVSYRDEVLLIPNAIRVVHLNGISEDAVSIVAGIGAAVGGHLDIYVWQDPWGWKNIFPPNGSMEYFYFFRKPTGLLIALSSYNHPGLNVTPPPVWYRWNGKRFVEIPPPPGSSSWPLPD